MEKTGEPLKFPFPVTWCSYHLGGTRGPGGRAVSAEGELPFLARVQ